ncbi:MAG: hypothetical protein JSV23_11240 [Promethearchaeota archaeon]|nr:MAG: hypothetical protein JSV23_11240 [Candidatus Lokiarchaeota archaeon]
MNKKIVIPLIVVFFGAILVIALIILTLPPPIVIIPPEGERKAIIVGSANDFYGSNPEDDFNGGNDSSLNKDTSLGNWSFTQYDGGTDAYHNDTYGHPSNPLLGSIFMDWSAAGPGFQNATFVLDWNANYDLINYVFYNISVWIEIQGADFSSGGARVGIRWKNSTGNIVRTDWTNDVSLADGQWHLVSISSVCNNETNYEITQMELILAAEGNFLDSHQVYFDEIKVDRWIQINVTDPTDPDPPPTGKDSDGFPAQALQAYWILRNHGYSDEDILFMLYYKNDADGIIDIDAFDAVPNDLVGAVIDVENDDVNASRFKQELNVSIPGSFASEIIPEDQLIIYMVDHGSNAVLPDKNATFHFEADNSWIDEFEFYDLVKEIDCERMLILVDCCFSGNFLNENKNIGQSWYNLTNCIFISASSNVLAWYWIGNQNPDGFAGSWFFHPFWQQLDQNNSIGAAYNFALGFIPSTNQPRPVFVIQNPLMYDNLKINDTWGFNGDPKL